MVIFYHALAFSNFWSKPFSKQTGDAVVILVAIVAIITVFLHTVKET